MANKGAFKKGEKRPGQGRPKGSLDKGNALIREMVVEALHGVGGVAYLQERATDPRTATAFLGLIGKVLPVQVEGGDKPVAHTMRVIFEDGRTLS